MKPVLYAHPFSSYCQKALIALYENATDFDYRLLDHKDPETLADFEKRWPIKRFPILVDGDRTIVEASIVIEYLGLHHPGPVKLIPDDPKAALEVRMLDRFFDNYISTPQQRIVFNAIRPEAERDPYGDSQARDMLERAYAWLDTRMEGRTWAVGDSFTLADCGAAPFLFYADWTHAIAPAFAHVHAYRRRLLARPSFARAVNEARPFRKFFPLGAPDRD
ncbi:glutathione S-transferase family protein [Shinella sp. S4-D37]|uniref:glutathione S-transferase family protein n=1 Tax=Shinella sp. S4-D37 TaxID=3161999 RepID=UPI00346502C7